VRVELFPLIELHAATRVDQTLHAARPRERRLTPAPWISRGCQCDEPNS
jgi:hypothetical protein